MFSHVRSAYSSPRPRKGLNAEILVDGLSPGSPREVFNLEWQYSMVAYYLLESERGFRRIIPIAQFPPSEFITIKSAPQDLDQYRLAFGLTLIEDSKEAGASMGIKVLMKERIAARFVQIKDSASCIRFLEVIEGVDDLSVRFRFRDNSSGTLVSGNFLI